jgi:hypothetical protein
MIARELLGTAQVPGGEELRLFAHGRDFIIALDRNELMSTRMRHSEEQLAELTLARLDCTDPHLLIGGYGMGFTLRAALAARPRMRATVAELVPEIITWARGPMAELTRRVSRRPARYARPGRRLCLHRRRGRRHYRALRRDPARRRQWSRRARARAEPPDLFVRRPARRQGCAGARRGAGGVVGGARSGVYAAAGEGRL